MVVDVVGVVARSDDVEIGMRQFLEQDPDGYLLRFSEWIGDCPCHKGQSGNRGPGNALAHS